MSYAILHDWVMLTCQNCAETLTRPHQKTYCNTCQGELKYKTTIAAWLAGTNTGLDNSIGTVSQSVKRWLRETRGDKCELCGWCSVNPSTGKVPVHADHIDGNHANNRPENLRLICPNCHSLTSTFGNLNRGKGRSFRYT
jgi:Zn finger protein HypA/HybF involved in hydrogenase expression